MVIPKGQLDLDESIAAGALREFYEETGVPEASVRCISDHNGNLMTVRAGDHHFLVVRLADEWEQQAG